MFVIWVHCMHVQTRSKLHCCIRTDDADRCAVLSLQVTFHGWLHVVERKTSVVAQRPITPPSVLPFKNCLYTSTYPTDLQVYPQYRHISKQNSNYEDNQQDATIQVSLLFLVSSTCFGRCFRPSSGALNCIYSIW